ncbi:MULTISPECIES: sigma-70 family RNA polymerase sigma factor [Prevotellaceae]|uniref:sigma-70 family RNA polymerase sigma factor n=1 Tax=Prevotellaceae TaxID=171552 RepID=UPI000AE8D101|nr:MULTISPECIES: sigma-70 family RNA polymerase sigma factor [Prevotellaceae]QVJ81675.1 sigma-70 family RNA polymerase sigma factor [Xylanibacter ruminicola]
MSKMHHLLENRSEGTNHYLKQIEDNQPLTLEEEQELGRRILAGDTSARNKLIEANLRFVLTCAIEMATPLVPIEELIAAGNYGLTIAANRYDPSFGNHFCSYAVHHIRRAISEAIKAWTCTVKAPTLFESLMACLSLDDRNEDDEDNWSRDLIDRIPAAIDGCVIRRDMEEAKEHLRSFLSKWYYPSDVELLLDLAQMIYDGYDISDLAKKHNLPVKRMKSIIADLRKKAQLNKLQAAYAKAA